MAERTKTGAARTLFPRSRATRGAASNLQRQISWILTRESLFRLALSVVLALALWLYVTAKQDPGSIEFSQPLPVATSNVGAGLTVTNRLGVVRVRYRTNNPNLYVTPSSFHVSVNLLNRTPGEWSHLPVEVVADPGLSITQVSPKYVAVAIDRVLERRVPVLPNILTAAPYGYNAGAPLISPLTVKISGPAALVSQVTQARVDLSLSGQRTGLFGSFPVLLADSQGVSVAGSTNLVVSPPEVQVQLPIKTVASFKTLPLLVPIKGHPKQGFGVTNISPQPSAITVRGSPSILNRLSSASTSAVSISGRGAGNLTAHVRVRLPKGVTTQTHRVTVLIQLKPVDASTSVEIGVSPENVAIGLTAHIRPAYVLVTLVGPSSGLGRVAHKTTAVVDLTNFGFGSFTLRPVIRAPAGFQIGDVYPPMVNVTLVQASASR
ncbi:MAG: hypothetical protein NVSMB52_10980 [Chloroflexota bacterium]